VEMGFAAMKDAGAAAEGIRRVILNCSRRRFPKRGGKIDMGTDHAGAFGVPAVAWRRWMRHMTGIVGGLPGRFRMRRSGARRCSRTSSV